MNNYIKYSAKYRINTPAFVGGADNASTAELRLPSIKGALRFWWRALMAQSVQKPDELYKLEGALFGSSSDKVGQSAVIMKLQPADYFTLQVKQVLKDNDVVVGQGARYFGYGVMEAFGSDIKKTEAGELTRPCISAPSTFTINFLLKTKGLSESTQENFEKALKILGLLGGIGSKSRKGYGSLTLESLIKDGAKIWTPPSNFAELIQCLTTLGLRKGFSEEPAWTGFSQNARIVVLPSKRNESALGLLNRIGEDQIGYRSWGRNRKVLGGKEHEKNFEKDHDIIKGDYQDHGDGPHYPERIAFGLPHTANITPNGKNLERRSSPIFIHIHQLENAEPVGVVTFLPSQFLPDGDNRIKVRRQSYALNQQVLWKPIDKYLQRLLSQEPHPHGTKQIFKGAKEVELG